MFLRLVLVYYYIIIIIIIFCVSVALKLVIYIYRIEKTIRVGPVVRNLGNMHSFNLNIVRKCKLSYFCVGE